MPPEPPRAVDLLIRDAYVITMDAARTIHPRGAVAVDGGRIVAVGPEAEVAATVRAARVIDAGGAAVHPGFVDCHAHVTFHLVRGAFGDACPIDAFARAQFPYAHLIDDEEEHASALLSVAEMLRSGTTCFVEAGTAFEPDAAAAAAQRLGIRALLGDPFVMDLGDVGIERVTASLERSLDVLGGQLHRNADPDALVRGAVVIQGIGTSSDELHLAAHDLATRAGVILNQHQNYEQADADAHDRHCGCHGVAHLERIGALSERVLLGHLNVVRDDEYEALLRCRPAVAWNPTGSMLWGVGGTLRGRHLDLHRAGLPVALGSDASNWANAFDVGEQGYVALLTQRERYGARDAMTALDVMEMATIGGARAAGLADQIGSLEAGKRADLVIRSDDLPEMRPSFDPLAQIVLSSRARSVRTVVVDGRVVLEDGALTGLDAREIAEGADRAAAGLFRRMGYRGDMTGRPLGTAGRAAVAPSDPTTTSTTTPTSEPIR